LERCPNCSADVFEGATDCPRCGAILLGGGRFELPDRPDPSADSAVTTGQFLVLALLFFGSALVSLVLWIMAVPGSGDFEGYFVVITACFVASHIGALVLAVVYVSLGRPAKAQLALACAPIVGFVLSILIAAAVNRL